MDKQSWEIPDPPAVGDPTEDITFRAVGMALSQWEWFEGNLSLAFSYLIGAGFGNFGALRAYGTVESFRGRANMLWEAADVYFKLNRDERTESALSDLLKRAGKFSTRRNEIAHGIVQLWFDSSARPAPKGHALFPAYYATRKRKLPESGSIAEITPSYIYSSVEIGEFGRHFANLANNSIELLTFLATLSQGKT
jgi:hypothetical protein